MGIERALVTCHKSNTGSRKINERNGGVLENEVRVPGQPEPKLGSWIATDPAATPRSTLADRAIPMRNRRFSLR